MILPSEAAVIHIFACEVRRIAVGEGGRAVIVLYKGFEVLVFNDHILAPLGKILHERKQRSEGKRLTGKGLTSAGIAVADELQEHSGSAQVVIVPCRRIQRPHFLGGHFGQHYFGQTKLCF